MLLSHDDTAISQKLIGCVNRRYASCRHRRVAEKRRLEPKEALRSPRLPTGNAPTSDPAFLSEGGKTHRGSDRHLCSPYLAVAIRGAGSAQTEGAQVNQQAVKASCQRVQRPCRCGCGAIVLAPPSARGSNGRRAVIGPNDWPHKKIVAEVHRRGLTLAGLSRQNGLGSPSLKHAIAREWRKGELIIAEAIGVHAEEIWPSRYEARAARLKTGKARGKRRPAVTSKNRAAGSARSKQK
jgi:Ner family transcriptional regulator